MAATHPAYEDLLHRWVRTLLAARAFGGAGGPDPTPHGPDLLARWAENGFAPGQPEA